MTMTRRLPATGTTQRVARAGADHVVRARVVHKVQVQASPAKKGTSSVQTRTSKVPRR